jgi:hypothetical protein
MTATSWLPGFRATSTTTQVRSASAGRRRQLDDVGELADDRDLLVAV